MVIDLFTVIAQIINFVILVFLLKRFLFNPILGIIDQREAQIADRIHKAEEDQAKAEQELQKQRELKEKLEQEWDQGLAEVKEKVKSKQEEMMEEAKKSVDEAQQNWKEAISKQRSSFLRELKDISRKQVWKISRKVLSDLANEDLEKQLVKSFLSQLENPDSQAGNKEFLSGLGKEKKMEILTGFQLSKEDKKDLIDKINDIAGEKKEITFKQSKDLISGIELRAEGKKITWSIESYLDMIERNLQEYFRQRLSQDPGILEGKEEKNQKKEDARQDSEKENEQKDTEKS